MSPSTENMRDGKGCSTPVDPVGAFGGLCNRTACRAPGATWFNTSTRKHYCRRCAGLINRAAQQYGEQRLCVAPEDK
jgi:hypothetical protein